MVVLSAAITTRSGKALVARQFVEMTRIRIEGLLAAFPKLLGSTSAQHTYVETESVRYLYQPLSDVLFLLLVTNRASNIIEDLETLRLLSKVVPDVCASANNLSEERITDKCFELIFAFDEVLTAGGYREPITLQQIRTNLEMESHEEKLHNMIKVSKMESAKDQAREAARTIREKQKDARAPQGFGGGGIGSDDSRDLMMGSGGGGGGGGGGSSSHDSSRSADVAASSPRLSSAGTSSRAPAIKGMSLSAMGGKNKSLEEALVKEDKLAPVMMSTKSSLNTAAASSSVVVQPLVQHPVMLVVNERICAKMSRDGMIESFEIKGSLTLTAATDEAALCAVQLAVGPSEEFTFNTHPKVNKALYDKTSLLQLKDTTKGFPSQRPVGILRWTHASTSDDMIPIKINCWPEEESRGQMNVTIEYNVEQTTIELHNVRIHIPLGTSASPNIVSVDGTHKHSASANELIWEIALIDASNAAGTLEFNIAQKNGDSFFPINVSFSSPQLYCAVEVTSVKGADDAAIQFGLTRALETESYVIE